MFVPRHVELSWIEQVKVQGLSACNARGTGEREPREVDTDFPWESTPRTPPYAELLCPSPRLTCAAKSPQCTAYEAKTPKAELSGQVNSSTTQSINSLRVVEDQT